MRMRVTDEGLVIPKAFLRDWDEVEIRRQDGGVMIAPVATIASSEDDDDVCPVIPDDDPIYDLGKDPVEDELTDAATNLDKYLYSDSERL